MNNKYNQFVKSRMNIYQSDTEKLITLVNHIRKKYNIITYREKILLFEFDSLRFVNWTDSVTQYQFHSHIIHCPDIIFYVNGTLHIIEIDGSIHNDKQKVQVRDQKRNSHYKQAGIPYYIINEQNVALKNGTFNSMRGATIDEIWNEIQEKLDPIV